jgi:rSAM/selenodomain-associated transferase 1
MKERSGRQPVALIVLAKAPVPGRSKTRLCPPLDPDQAALVAEAALADTLDAVASSKADERVVSLEGPTGSWLPEGFEVISQRGAGLDERLAAAAADVGRTCLIIGMDTPQAGRRLLDRAIETLLRPGVDAVLGPAADGGWWALGLRRPDPEVFLGVPMSTAWTGQRQEERLRSLGLATRRLRVLRDVDVFEDARAVAASIPGSRFARAVATVAAPSRDGMVA